MSNKATTLKHPNLIQLTDLMVNVVQAWKNQKDLITTDPMSFGVPNISKQDFHEVIISLENFLKSTDINLLFNPIAASTCLRNGQYQAQSNNLIGHINSLSLSPQNWPTTIDLYYGLISMISAAFFGGANVSLDGSKALKAKAIQINDTHKNIEQLEGYAESTKKSIEATKSETEIHKIQYENLHTQIVEELDSLEKYKQGLNQKGLSAAFTSRSEKLNWPLRGWLLIFISSILIICCVSLLPHIIETFNLNNASNKDNYQNAQNHPQVPYRPIEQNSKDLLIGMLIKLLMSSPMIWLAWFSAKRYSHTKKLQEEYEFKTATATAYYGYHKEASSNEELKNLLLQGAIKNFNENPSQGIDNHKVSPLEEIVLDLLKKADPSLIEKILEQLKNLKK